MEMFNELIILIISLTLPLFTDFSDSIILTDLAGWFLMGLIALNFVVNFAVVFILKLFEIRCSI